MEDISRELEREIAQTKPKPYKQDRKSRILIIDDFGMMKSGEYLKKLVMWLSAASAVFFVAAVLFFFLYNGLASDAKVVKIKLGAAEKKLGDLTREKEVLMARLVILGKEPGIQGIKGQEKTPVLAPVVEKKSLVAKKQDKKPVPAKAAPVSSNATSTPVPPPSKASTKPQLKTTTDSKPVMKDSKPAVVGKKMVSIEKFTVVKDGNNGDLLVRFDIRNTSSAPGDVSGRIFTLLKPENLNEDQWLVVPSSKLKEGVPSERRKGQYFSIAHFKPVKFRIKNQASPDFFKKASIYIFNNQGELMVEKLIDITEAQ